jgi:glutaredoxin
MKILIVLITLTIMYWAFGHYQEPQVSTPLTPHAETANDALAKISPIIAQPGITLFTATWCGYCDKLRTLLTKQNIPFREYDVEHSQEGAWLMNAFHYEGVPIVLINGKTIEGYDVDALDKTFKEAHFTVTGL